VLGAQQLSGLAAAAGDGGGDSNRARWDPV
jgi:hypothetical protein